MKLKQLTIQNIASIEHAVINFDAAPLANERLFLITGETGSGKSTIIDCLCLALYGSTPRMKGARGNTSYETSKQVKDDISTNSTKQLLRRGSTQAIVELTFNDNLGTPYIATWEVHRAHGRLYGKTSGVARTLRTADGATTVVNLTKTKEIDQHIEGLIGLDVDQFFRTVVLAQGKFAEFLNSDEKEKSDLLEKMTGTEIYSQVGARIYQEFQHKENNCRILRGQMEGIVLLNDEQKALINDEMGRLSHECKAVDEQLKLATDMSNWLKERQRVKQEAERQQALLNEAMAQAATPQHRQEQALLDDWDATTSVRHHLAEHRLATAHIEQLNGQRQHLQHEYDRLCAGLRASIADLEAKQQKADAVEAFLNREQGNKAMYAAVGQIKSLWGRLQREKDNIVDFGHKLTDEQRRLPPAQQAVKDAESACSREDTAVKTLQRQQDDMHIADLIGQKDRLVKASQALETLKAKHTAVDQAGNRLESVNQRLEQEQQALDQAQATIQAKREAREEAWQNAERQKGWNDLLVQAHKTLHQGDTCPVCGNVIDQLMPQGESVLLEMQQRLKQADDALREAETRIQATSKLIADYRSQQAAHKTSLQDAVDQRQRHWEHTRLLLGQCGRRVDDMVDDEGADALIGQLEAETRQVNARLESADALKAQISEAQKRLDKANKSHNQALIALNKVEESIKYQQSAIDTSKKNAQTLTDELNGLIVIADWQEHASSQPDFIHRLETAAADYRRQETLAQDLASHISVARALIPAMQESKRNIKGLDDHGDTITQAPQGLDKLWRQLEKNYVEWNSRLEGERDNATRTKQAIDAYLAHHDAMTPQRLEQLSSHSEGAIDDIKQRHRLLSDTMSGLKGAIESLANQQATLDRQKPAFNEEDLERLDEYIGQRKGHRDTLAERIAELTAQLRTDKEKADAMSDKRERLEKAEAERLRWESMNTMLGSADGTKFRKIAQSYILGDLLARANGYLRQFNNHYELEAKPASLYILARDLVQGDLTSVTTLSGGESFMVSLALALALSNMTGRMFSIDTIFIDEGFGSLSPNYLDKVMETLNNLYDMGGRRVGIISHVEMLKERVPTQIQVTRDSENNTISRVTVQ